MTDKIGIDEQIARIKRRVELERELEQLEIGDLPIYLAVLETLRDYKRIMGAKVPEPVAWTWQYFENQSWEGRGLANRKPPFDAQPLYTSEVLDLLRRETERLRENVKQIYTSLQAENERGAITDTLWMLGGNETIFDAIAALLAEVEKDNHD